jgi:excinuclease ABC subunit A
LIEGKNIAAVAAMAVEHAFAYFKEFEDKLSGSKKGGKNKKLEMTESELSQLIIAEVPLREILARLKFLADVGLEYLTSERKAGTLSGGEAQRIRLASQIGSRLVGTLYILDEPTIGLAPARQRQAD